MLLGTVKSDFLQYQLKLWLFPFPKQKVNRKQAAIPINTTVVFPCCHGFVCVNDDKTSTDTEKGSSALDRSRHHEKVSLV